jgi:hypothetical protein
MKEILIKVFHSIGLAVWVEIITDNPRCTYYFGPFLNNQEAQAAKSGYIEDLENEGAQCTSVTVKRCKPTNLTIFDELGEQTEGRAMTTLSGQMS